MKKFNILALLFPLAIALQGQDYINNMATDNNVLLCQPGVLNKTPGKGAAFTYSVNPDFKMRPPDAENPSKVQRNERFDTKLKVPVIMKDKFKLILGLQYTLERYHFVSIVPENYPLFNRLNSTDLKTAGMAAYIVMPINHKYYTSFRLSASFQGDYDEFINLDNRYGIYRAAGIFGVKKRNDLEYGIGLLYSRGFSNNSLVPFGFLNYTINEHWGIETALPTSIKIRHNFSSRSLMLFGTEYSSQNYALKTSQPSILTNQNEWAPYHFRRSSIDLTVSYYQQLTGWTWLEFKTGYAFSLNSRARDVDIQQNYDLQPSGSMIGVVSFFISPPRGKGKE